MTAAAELRTTVGRWASRLRAISDADSARAPAPGKWSPRQIIGHLIDSAGNNHQRFVRACFTRDLVCPTYEQDAWVDAQHYATAPWPELVELWRTFNLHLARVIDVMPDDVLTRSRSPHNLREVAFRTFPEHQPATLAWFVEDYVMHLHHHLAQIERALAGGRGS